MEESINRAAYVPDCSTTQDELHFSDYRSALLKILKEAQTPLTVGVFGPWGSGKTSLLQMLKEKLEERRSPRFRAVWFTAWKYDRNEALWRTFILRVLDALYPRVEGKGPWEERKRIPAKDLVGEQKTQVEHLDRLSRSLYEKVEWRELGRWVMKWQETVKELGKLPAFLLLFCMGAGKLAVTLGMNPNLADLVQREVHVHRLEQLASMEQFEAAFEEALTRALGKRGRLIVFVDDLDRCLPEKAVEVLEAIKLFLEVKGTVFVLGMDPEVIERGIEARYKDFLLQGTIKPGKDSTAGLPICGSVYLEKIVQIPFHLPPLAEEDLEEYIRALEKGVPSGARLDDMTRAVFAHGLRPNPRQVKRALNIFHLLKEIALEREERPDNEGGLRKGSIAWPLLAKTVLIQTQWPELYQDWRQYPVLIQMLEAEYARQPYTQEEALRGLVALPPSEQSEGKREGNVQAGGLLEPYLRNRDPLLGQMLAFPEEKEAGEGRELARFAGLSRQEMAVYVRLAAVASPEEPSVGVPGDLLAELHSEDKGRVQDAAARLTEEIITGEAQAEQIVTWVQEQEPRGEGPVHQALQERLQYVMRSPARARSTQARVSAGDALSLLGDPRFRSDFWFMRDDLLLLGFVKIEEGPFLMGEGDEQHEFTLPTYYIARYPVTVAQFRAYAGDIAPERANAIEGLDNHPVVGVNWNEALGYCEWLKKKLELKDTPEPLKTLLKKEGWTITLPSEAEWEKAARGALEMENGLTIGGVDGLSIAFQGKNPEPSRMYPWGNELDPGWANYMDTGIGTTSAVGCFLNGVSPWGVEDLSGNVWEWTRSLWGRDERKAEFEYPYDPKDGRENLEADQLTRRVLRGGAFNNEGRDIRCAHRISNYPDRHGKEMGFRVTLTRLEPDSMDSSVESL